jgi:hypothetical protein
MQYIYLDSTRSIKRMCCRSVLKGEFDSEVQGQPCPRVRVRDSMLYFALLLLSCRNNYRTHSLSASEATLGRPPAPCSRIIIIIFLLHSLSDGHTFVHNNWPRTAIKSDYHFIETSRNYFCWRSWSRYKWRRVIIGADNLISTHFLPWLRRQ